jgi:NAD+ synthase
MAEDTPVDLHFSEAELEARRERIVDFIEETVAAAGAEGAVLGFSGGIDSTLTGHLAVEALGAQNLRGLVMPGAVSRESNMSDAERVVQELEIPYDVVEIDPVVERFLDVYPEAEGDTEAVGNARARVRGVLNYLVANHEGRVVLGTGNRTESMVGYFTKYGDQAVDCNPIGNLYKVQVRQLARQVGVREAIVTKSPTAGLWEDQTDEEEMGVDYATLDRVLALHVDGPFSASATAETASVAEEVVERVAEMVATSEHKRHVPPAPDPL